MSSRPPASPDSYSSKKGFKQAFKRPFFARRGASSNSGSSKPPSLSLSSSQNAASRKSSTSTAYPEFDRSSPGDPAQSNTVRWKDHAAAASSGTREVDQNGAPRRSSSSHGSQDAGQQSQSTPIGAPANYFGSALGTPTPTLGASAPITSLHFVQTLNALLLEPTTLTICQLAPPSVLPIPWNDSPYSSSSVQGPSSTSLSTYVSQGSMSADHSSSAMCVSNQQTYGCNEQLAASALSLPSVSVAALWRASSCMQWINESADPFCRSIDQFEAGSYLDAKNPDLQSKANEEDPHSPPGWRPEKQSVFEIGGLLQNVMDVLSSSAAKQRVELVLYHGRDPMIEPSQANEFRPEGGLRELHCRGDDAGIATALMAIVCKILQQSQPGDTIEVGLSLTCLATDPDMDNLKESNLFRSQAERPASVRSKLIDEDEDEEERTPWEATLDIAHSCAPDADELVDSMDPFARDPLIETLTKGTGMRIGTVNLQNACRRSWPVVVKLQQTIPPACHPDVDVSSGSSHRRKHLAELSKEPSVSDLIRFSETFLRGKKAVIHSAEQSLFAKHMTGYLAMWGLHPTHVPLESQKEDEPHEPIRDAEGFLHPKTQPQSPPLDPSVNFIFIDDDISTLRRQLVMIKNSAPQLQLPNALLNKRPGLQNRRTRSTAHIKPNSSGAAATNSHLTVIHCTSLSKFRYIRELAQSIFRSVSPAFPLPEVFVLPKPVGPRRLLTALHTSLKKPFLDAAALPIATSPSSPGGHFFVSPSSRASPAPSSHQDFDTAFGAHAHAVEQNNSYVTPKTPPYAAAPLAPAPATTPSSQDPPSPRPASSEAIEYLEYMSKTSKDLGGDSSSGIVIQSQDGKAQGLYFHPKRGSMGQSIRSITRPTRLNADNFNIVERRDSLEDKSEEEGQEDANTPASPTADVDTAASETTPSKPPLLKQVTEESPSPFDKTTDTQEPKSEAPEEVESPPSLPAIAPMVSGDGVQDASTTLPTSIMSPPLAAGDRALPLDSFTSVGHPPQNSRSVSDHIVQTTPVANAGSPPNLSRTVTAPSVLPLSMAPDLPPVKLRASETAAFSPSTPAPSAAVTSPKQQTSPKSPTFSSSKPTSPVSSSGQNIPISGITGPPAAILAKTAGRKPRNDSGKAKRKVGTPVVPPVNVLIVEDNRIEQVVVSTFLRRHGIRCSVAANGQEAVDKWKTGGFHLVLMDIQLPVKSGMEATMEIRELERINNIAAFQMTPTNEGTPSTGIQQQVSSTGTEVPSRDSSAAASPHQLPVIIVALTASSLPADRISALAAGCNDFITKPVSHKWLHQKVLEWGSMSYLSSFRRIRTPVTSPASTLMRAGLTFDRVAAQTKAKEIAEGLHIDRKPKESVAPPAAAEKPEEPEEATSKGGDAPVSRPELSAFKPGSSTGSVPTLAGSHP